MISKSKLATLFAVSSFVVAGAAAPAAASPMSNAFLANARANVDFLDASSRMALTQSSNPRIRAFAHREAWEETIASNALVAHAAANGQTVIGPRLTADNGPLSPLVDVATLPLDIATNVTTSVGNNVDAVLSGRSVAIDDPLAPRLLASPSLTAGAAELDRMRSMRGRDFDALYRSTQRDALTQLATIYRDYLQNGDDMALRAIAKRELPKINRDLRELSSI